MTQLSSNNRIALSRCAAALLFALSAAAILLDASAAASKPFSLKSFRDELAAGAEDTAPPEPAETAPSPAPAPSANPVDESLPFSDPLEPANRVLHDLNRLVYAYAFDPAATAFIDNTSPETRAGIFNMMENLREPITVSSALIEGDLAGAGSATTRFAINSTLGVFGYYDVAKESGYPRQGRTVEQALCRQSVPSGPYLVMPVLGPATVRDAAARLATMYAQYMILGLAIIPYRIADIISHYADRRDEFRALDDMLIDNYAGYRSVYGQLLSAKCTPNGITKPTLFKP